MLTDKFTASVQFVFMKGKGIQLKAQLSSDSMCSLATLSRMSVFNDTSSGKLMNVGAYADGIKAGGTAPIQFGERTHSTGTQISFDMLVLYNNEEQAEDHANGEKPNGQKPIEESSPTDPNAQKPSAKTNSELTVQSGGKGDDKKPTKGYTIKHIKFISHIGLG